MTQQMSSGIQRANKRFRHSSGTNSMTQTILDITLPEEKDTNPAVHDCTQHDKRSPSKKACVTLATLQNLYLETDLQCNICFGVILEAQAISCGHTFCYYCIYRWSFDSNNCPVCRSEVHEAGINPVLALDRFLDSIFTLIDPETAAKREQQRLERRELLFKEESDWFMKQQNQYDDEYWGVEDSDAHYQEGADPWVYADYRNQMGDDDMPELTPVNWTTVYNQGSQSETSNSVTPTQGAYIVPYVPMHSPSNIFTGFTPTFNHMEGGVFHNLGQFHSRLRPHTLIGTNGSSTEAQGGNSGSRAATIPSMVRLLTRNSFDSNAESEVQHEDFIS